MPAKNRYSSNEHAARVTILILERAGALKDVDSALLHLTLSLSRAMDKNPGNAQLARQYRDTLEALRRGHGVTDGVGNLIDDLRAEVGDTEEAGEADIR